MTRSVPIKIKGALIALITCSEFLSACNTMKGIGRDVKSVGDKVEDVAD